MPQHGGLIWRLREPPELEDACFISVSPQDSSVGSFRFLKGSQQDLAPPGSGVNGLKAALDLQSGHHVHAFVQGHVDFL